MNLNLKKMELKNNQSQTVNQAFPNKATTKL